MTFCLLPRLTELFQKEVYSQWKKIHPRAANSFFQELTPLRREAKMKMAELPPLKACSSNLKYSRLSLSRNRRDPLKHFEISVLRHIRFAVKRKKQFEKPNFTNDNVI